MCGINGFNWLSKIKVGQMNDAIKHRGPDAEGTYLDKSVTLGHRRLSILDLSKKGSQPMKYFHNGQKYVIVYNGEVYNFKEIREDLKEKGYKFYSDCDTEVIVAAYSEWGEKCVGKFNGMWAFCIYDIFNKKLFLSRDGFGQKPLHYYFNGNRFIFSSEIKGILKHKVERRISKESVDLFLSLGFIPAPRTIYENIKKLEAGTNLVFDLQKKKLDKKRYYFPSKYSPEKDKKKLIEECKRLIKKSIERRMIADVEVGAFLSGGIDSSTVICNMDELTEKNKLTTFSIGLEASEDEKYAKFMTKRLGLKNEHKDFTKKEFQKTLKDIFYFFDEPFTDYSMFPSYMLSEMASKKLKVCLSGDGGDEVFGGYSHYNNAAQIVWLRRIPRFLRKIFVYMLKGFGSEKIKRVREGIKISLKKPEEIFSDSVEFFYKPPIYKKILKEKMKEMLKYSNGNLIEAMILLDRHFKTMGDNFLCKTDRSSMAHGLEVRSPFLDHELMEYASKIPTKWKANTKKGKILMKEMLRGVVPDEILDRSKAGFSFDLHRWIEELNDEKILGNIVESLSSKKILSSEWREFYLDNVLITKEDWFGKYKVRLFILNEWAKTWL